MRSSWIRVGPKSNDKYYNRQKRRRHRGRHRGEDHVDMEAEIGVMQPQAKECREPPKARKGKEGFSHRVSGGNVALLSL